MTMNLVGQQKLFEVPSSMEENMDEDIVYSVITKDTAAKQANQQPQGVLQLLR
ncbi:hypothetical protein [Neobacillus mesonae]|uniref:hypothetical protein n=1 Tax=Neobacillus mesonae TaxID=1193713 RepID=UPI00203F74A1|nr:hypothetical protein [Neobacillus mesonae]MCM3566998.1 hypothetical protein [Neobacillus mesonae]